MWKECWDDVRGIMKEVTKGSDLDLEANVIGNEKQQV